MNVDNTLKIKPLYIYDYKQLRDLKMFNLHSEYKLLKKQNGLRKLNPELHKKVFGTTCIKDIMMIKNTHYNFNTEFYPAIEFIAKLSKKYPNLIFTYDYINKISRFKGTAIFKNGCCAKDVMRDIIKIT